MTYFEPSIPEYFSGKTIFITGGLGFLGKALTEKFLRSCSDLKKIYLLVRPKKGRNVRERIRTFAEDPIFERVKREQPNLIIENRVLALAGDCTLLNLGLSPEDRNIITEKVDIIFHVAASVRFDDPLTDAIIMNTRGTREACQIALVAKNIKAFIYVSTTYVNSDRIESKEMLYPPKLDWKKSIEIAEENDKYTLDTFSAKIVNNLSNTYTFSKSIAEHVVADMLGGKIPCKIYRPSVVASAMKDEPIKGWVDNLNGPTGIMIAGGLGILRTLYINSEVAQDYIPIDVVTKSIIVCTWDLAVRSSSSKTVLPTEVIHGSSFDCDWLRVSANKWGAAGLKAQRIVPLNDVFWTPVSHHTDNFYHWYIRTMITMVLPSILIDGFLKMTGKKPRLLKIQKAMYAVQILMAPIINTKFSFCNDNLLNLLYRIQERDKDSFDFDFRNYDIDEYVFNMLMGFRRYILKTPDSTIENARRHYKRILMIKKAVYTIFWILFMYFAYTCFFFFYYS